MTEPIALVILNNGSPVNDKERDYVLSTITKRLEGYRTLIGFQYKPEKDIITIQVFNGDSISDIQFEELKSIVNKLYEE